MATHLLSKDLLRGRVGPRGSPLMQRREGDHTWLLVSGKDRRLRRGALAREVGVVVPVAVGLEDELLVPRAAAGQRAARSEGGARKGVGGERARSGGRRGQSGHHVPCSHVS